MKTPLSPIKLKTHNEQTSTKFHQDLSLEIEALRQEWTQVPFNLKDLNEHIDNTISNNNFNHNQNSESHSNIDDIDIKNDRSLDNISNTSNPNSQSHLMQLNNSNDNSLNASPVRSKNIVNVNDDLRGTKSEIRGPQTNNVLDINSKKESRSLDHHNSNGMSRLTANSYNNRLSSLNTQNVTGTAFNGFGWFFIF